MTTGHSQGFLRTPRQVGIFHGSKANDTDYFASALVPSTNKTPTQFEVTVHVSSQTAVNAILNNAGSDLTVVLNSGAALPAGGVLTVELPVSSGQTLNLQHVTGTQSVYANVVEKFSY